MSSHDRPHDQSAAGRGVQACLFLVLELVTLFLTINHFVYSQTHPDEIIQWNLIYFVLMALMFLGTVAHAFFWALQKTSQDEFDKVSRIACSVNACNLFTAYSFSIVQFSEWANYSILNTSFPVGMIVAMAFMNLINVLVKARDHL